jgi:ABC-type transport system involved in multi-copper enzyme maturation permease subunit
MLWTIVKKQVLVNVLSYRFVVGFALCQVLFVLATVILVRDYEERVVAYGEAVSRSSRQLQEVKVFSQLTVGLNKAPSRLSPLCTGFDKKFGNQVSVSYTQIPELSAGRQEKNPLLAALHSIDLVGVIQLVLGLLVLLFAHDVVSGEREKGTLALSLSGALPRHVFLLGQYLGGMATIITVFLVGIALALLLLIRSSSLQFSSGEWSKLALLILLSVIYLSALYLLGTSLSRPRA